MEHVYTAGIQYSAESIKRLCQVRRKTFETTKRLTTLAASFLMILVGLFLSRENQLGVLMMLCGSILIMGIDAPATALADRIIHQFKGKDYPKIFYYFSENGITTNEMPEECPYHRIIALVEDKEYFYLFQNKLAAFMIQRSSLGEHQEDFKEFVSAHTALQFFEPFRLQNMNYRRLLDAIRLSLLAKTGIK
jgi:hypothetical protein